jgi:hypothetical protein
MMDFPMKTVGRALITLVIVAAGCAGGYELSDYYMPRDAAAGEFDQLSPRTRDVRVQADVASIAPDEDGFVDDLILDRERYTRALPRRMSLPTRRRWRCATKRYHIVSI